MKIELPDDVVRAIEKYTGQSSGLSSIGQLNLVAFIGERVAAVYAAEKKKDGR